ncbi:hypothetical protein CLUG_05220 [Clavispora lusitaniae ATCC 42720]|uniref:Uncharacterized protein n=1 Tax=Clavispora lusitaniae (strain ATCC 42720) TaxID=306902 RepID=C4YAJ2_CLAL4|nr:uncharacterized protein CLUG_05220 [Clavispora lusitaniae ATCC 42720]EEQ41092.1 hypothetical protein CLUG_05220 [Clavispora lusitaniae ATCC 42720]
MCCSGEVRRDVISVNRSVMAIILRFRIYESFLSYLIGSLQKSGMLELLIVHTILMQYQHNIMLKIVRRRAASKQVIETPCFPMETSTNDHVPASSEEIYRRMLEVEQELIEFQESSKELEQTLEDELRELESQNDLLLAQVRAKDAKISELSHTGDSLEQRTCNRICRMSAARDKENKDIIADLKKTLVAMEISNDDMASRDRVLEQKLSLANQFNNELLEKIALTENDLEMEREANARHQLTISNMQNAANTGNTTSSRIKRDSTYQDFSMAEGTILDINEMLATEPPVPVKQRSMPRSDSLHKMQQLHSMSDILLHKVGEMNLALKSPSTTEVSKQKVPIQGEEKKPSLSYSPSIHNLSRIQRDMESQHERSGSESTITPASKRVSTSGSATSKRAQKLRVKEKD